MEHLEVGQLLSSRTNCSILRHNHNQADEPSWIALHPSKETLNTVGSGFSAKSLNTNDGIEIPTTDTTRCSH